MRTISESLARAASNPSQVIRCPYSNAKDHPRNCVCTGTGKVMVCEDCQGSGWNATLNHCCGGCAGKGAIVAAA